MKYLILLLPFIFGVSRPAVYYSLDGYYSQFGVGDTLLTDSLNVTNTATVSNLIASKGISITGASSTNRMLGFQTDGGSRWEMGADDTAESGADTGSGFLLRYFNDDGVSNSDVLTINRRASSNPRGEFTGSFSFSGRVSAPSLNISGPISATTMYASSYISSPLFYGSLANNNISQFTNDVPYLTSASISSSDLFVEIAGDTMTGKLITPELNSTGAISSTTLHTTSHASITGNFSVNGDTLKVNATSNRIGIGEGAPLKITHIRNTGTSTILGQLDTNLRLETRTGTVDAGNEISFMGTNQDGTTSESTLTYASIAAPVEGNAAATGARGYLSFNTKQSITDSSLTERMRILGSGAISMNGATTVGGLLTASNGVSVTGNVTATAGSFSGALSSMGSAVTNAGMTASNSTQWSSNNLSANILIRGSRNNALGFLDAAGSNPWAISARTTGDLRISTMPALGDTATAPTDRFTIDSGGNVGIATTSPSSKLSVSGTVSASGLLTAASGVSVTGNASLTGDLILATGKGVMSSNGVRILEHEDTLDTNVKAPDGTSARLNLEATGNMQFFIDTNNDQTDRTYVWYNDDTALGGTANQLMTLNEDGGLRVIDGDITAGTVENGSSTQMYLLGDYFDDSASVTGSANKICLFNCGTTKNYGIGVSSGDVDYVSAGDHIFYAGTTELGGWLNTGFQNTQATAMFGATGLGESEIEIDDNRGDSNNAYLTISNQNSNSYSGIYFKRRRSGYTTDSTGGAAIVVPSLEDSANGKLQIHVLSSMAMPVAGTPEDVTFDSTGASVWSTNSKVFGVGSIYDPTATLHIQEGLMSTSGGTCTFLNGSTSVSTSTNLSSLYSVGHPIRILNTAPAPDEFLYARVSAITSNEITLDESWTGTSGTGTCTRMSSSGKILKVDDGDAGEHFSVDYGAVTVNEDSMDIDFRVETDSNTHALFVDGGTNEVGFFTNDPLSSFHVSGSAFIGELTFGASSLATTNTSASALFVENVDMNLGSGGQDPANGATLGRLNFYSTDTSAGARQVAGYVLSRNSAGSAWSATSSTYDADMDFATINNGSLTTKMTLTKDGNVGIGTTAPTSQLHLTSGMLVSATGNGVSMTAAQGYYRRFAFQTSGVNRWLFGASEHSETGSSAGSSLRVSAWDDAGGFIDNAILISRASSLNPRGTFLGTHVFSGNVGIGKTTATGAALDVSGSVSITQNVTINGSTSISDSLDFTRINMQRTAYIDEDFYAGDTTGIGKYDWNFSSREDGGATPTVSYSTSSTLYAANRPGIIELTSGDDTDNQAVLYMGSLGGNIYRMGGGYFRFDTSIYIDQLATVSEDYDLIIGLCSNIPLLSTFTACTGNGVYFNYNRGTSSNWITNTCSTSGGCTSNTSSIAVTNDAWIRLTAIVNPNGTGVSFYVNGVKTTTDHTADIPTAAGELSGPTFSIYKSAGSSTRNFFVDYWSSGYKFTTER